MCELLKNILLLREEIDNLTEFDNEKAYEYCDLAIKFADNKEDISRMTSEKNYIENYIKDFKCRKGLLFSFPIGILFSVIYFLYQLICNLYSLTFGSLIVLISSSGAIATTISVLTACLLLRSDKFNNFLFKKYPSFKSMNDKVNNLNAEIKIKEENIANINKKKEEITNTISINGEILESKKKELSKLEQEYFNNIKKTPITKETTYTISSISKKRTRTIGNTLNQNLKLNN